LGGFVTRGKGVSVHRNTCKNFIQLSMISPDRLIPVSWGASSGGDSLYPVDIEIVAVDRQGLLRDILCLQDKLNHLSQQDFYFQKGQESQQQKLNSMKAEYDQMVETANGNEVDFFLEGIIEAETNINHYHTRACTLPIFAKIILEAQALSRISRYRDAIEAKGLFGTLKPLEEVMEDEAALLRVFSAR
jgi:hypothetical protein